MGEANDYSYNIASVEKTTRLIELLAETNGELSVLQIAKRLDTPSSSAERFLITLQNLGYVEKDEHTGKYRLTDRLLKIASNLITNHPLTVRYLDVMHTLAYNFKATTHIMAFYDLSTITIHKDLQTQNISYNNAFFDPKRQHYCSAPGKLLLSTLSEKSLSEYLSNMKFIKYTNKTIVSEKALRENLELIRELGYSVHDEEWLSGCLTIAFPLRVHGQIKGAMSVMCSIDRKDEMLSQRTLEGIKRMLAEPNV